MLPPSDPYIEEPEVLKDVQNGSSFKYEYLRGIVVQSSFNGLD